MYLWIEIAFTNFPANIDLGLPVCGIIAHVLRLDTGLGLVPIFVGRAVRISSVSVVQLPTWRDGQVKKRSLRIHM